MSAATNKASKETADLVVKFLSPNKGKANGPSNYLPWAGAMYPTIGARYNPMAMVFLDQKPCVVPDLEAEDVPQADEPGMDSFRLPISMSFESRR